MCPECSFEWIPGEASVADDVKVYKDAHGTVLQDGDTVMLTQNLKVKGTSSTIKTGTKVKNIRLVEGDHDIDCKVEGIGPMKLKTQFVKKV
jgi:protein PhnA